MQVGDKVRLWDDSEKYHGCYGVITHAEPGSGYYHVRVELNTQHGKIEISRRSDSFVVLSAGNTPEINVGDEVTIWDEAEGIYDVEGVVVEKPVREKYCLQKYLVDYKEDGISKRGIFTFKEIKAVHHKQKQPRKHSHYYKDASDLEEIDVYMACKLFGVHDASGCLQHAIKKILCAGGRGSKSKETDIKQAIDTLNRWVEIYGD